MFLSLVSHFKIHRRKRIDRAFDVSAESEDVETDNSEVDVDADIPENEFGQIEYAIQMPRGEDDEENYFFVEENELPYIEQLLLDLYQ